MITLSVVGKSRSCRSRHLSSRRSTHCKSPVRGHLSVESESRCRSSLRLTSRHLLRQQTTYCGLLVRGHLSVESGNGCRWGWNSNPRVNKSERRSISVWWHANTKLDLAEILEIKPIAASWKDRTILSAAIARQTLASLAPVISFRLPSCHRLRHGQWRSGF